MKSYLVKDLMVPLSEYATVTEAATLYESVLSLEEAQEKFEDKHTRYRHRAILILDSAIHQFIMGNHQSLLVTGGEKIVGILRLTDVFAAVFHKMKECFEA